MTDPSSPFFAVPKQPRLIWNNKDKRKAAEPLPSQTVEVIRPFYADRSQGALDMAAAHGPAPENRLIWTNDNLVALTSLLHGDTHHEPLEGKIALIYIDPPFAVQSDFKINVEIENGVADEKLPTLIEEVAYKDTWKDGLDSYLSMMRDRLEILKRLLAPTGSIYVHCDWHAGHYIKVLMDEVFGQENFLNEIAWAYFAFKRATSKKFPQKHDTILSYHRSENYTWHTQFRPHKEEYLKRFKKDKDGRLYRDDVNPTAGGTRIIYLDEVKGDIVDSNWTDIPPVNPAATDNTGFPTQKPVPLLQRIIAASSNPGDIVLDCFVGSGTTAVAAESMKDAEGKAAPRRWIAIDCGKFAVHITRKRLIEANARPFAVENVGFYARSGQWIDKWQNNPNAKTYRDAMVEVYGGASIEGFTYLHGRKGTRWVHVGPLNAPIADSQVECILQEAATTDTRAVDILSADIPIDFNPGEAEKKWGVTLRAKVIPQAAIDAVRERIKRKRTKDPKLEAAPDVHFFSPPDIEVRAETNAGGVTVKLTRLTVDLDDCLATQDAAKRAEIKSRITDWKALVDYWAVDWDYNGEFFRNDWQSFRTRKSKDIAPQAAHTYSDAKGDKRIAVKVTDIFGNDGLKVIHITL